MLEWAHCKYRMVHPRLLSTRGSPHTCTDQHSQVQGPKQRQVVLTVLGIKQIEYKLGMVETRDLGTPEGCKS